ncbi:hydrolase [Phyllobacterium phragmitis]|uniref:Hydrolase n=1 Tax=Phyllobacterium phragmitis TaxID=2670329 RepID=A0A2S9IZF1_9HYPH|nr:hydrolase [Phyllobacterium phragmitis]PRD45878.1 hydrolase [Phyllobacterium phragmitis]
MSKKVLTLRPDRLTDHYREIGPAALVAALLAAPRSHSDARNDNRRTSILTDKKSG